MRTLAELFKASIAKDHQLCSKNKSYTLEENGVPYQFKTSSEHTAGFRIEINNLKLFGNRPSKDVAKMCDALFVVNDKQKDFIIAVEIKTKHKRKYKKQLRNGCRFFQWLVQLFQDCDHYSGNPLYLGLLVWFPNPSQVPKNLTVAGANFKTSMPNEFDVYECRNTTELSLNDLLMQIKGGNKTA